MLDAYVDEKCRMWIFIIQSVVSWCGVLIALDVALILLVVCDSSDAPHLMRLKKLTFSGDIYRSGLNLNLNMSV